MAVASGEGGGGARGGGARVRIGGWRLAAGGFAADVGSRWAVARGEGGGKCARRRYASKCWSVAVGGGWNERGGERHPQGKNTHLQGEEQKPSLLKNTPRVETHH